MSVNSKVATRLSFREVKAAGAAVVMPVPLCASEARASAARGMITPSGGLRQIYAWIRLVTSGSRLRRGGDKLCDCNVAAGGVGGDGFGQFGDFHWDDMLA